MVVIKHHHNNIIGGDNIREEGENINFKHWLGRTIMVGIILVLLIGIIDRYFGALLLVEAIKAMLLAIMCGLLHEYLHYRKALQLGYRPVWWRTRMRMGFVIDTHDKTEEQQQKDSQLSNKALKRQNVKDTHLIGRAPYKIILPLCLVFLIIGYVIHIQTEQWGVLVGTFAVIVMHLYTYRLEGIEV